MIILIFCGVLSGSGIIYGFYMFSKHLKKKAEQKKVTFDDETTSNLLAHEESPVEQ